jgi:hypothetical protein
MFTRHFGGYQAKEGLKHKKLQVMLGSSGFQALQKLYFVKNKVRLVSLC